MSAWDDLMAWVDAHANGDVPGDAEADLLALVQRAQADRSVDRELHAPDVARWLVGLVLGHAELRRRTPRIDADLDQADLRLIVTRWLHPARPSV